MTKSFVKLVMVTDTDNHNKEYCMESHGDYFIVRYGRVGARFATKQYPITQWDKKYQEKIQKGYQDMTAFCEIKQRISQGNWKEISNPNIAKLVEYLLQKARTVLKKEYQYSISQTTQAMVDEVQSYIDILTNSKLSVETFNDILKQIFTIIPRKMHDVEAYLAKNASDFPNILEREQKLLDTMAGQIRMDTVADTTQTTTEQTILEKMGLHIRLCTPEEKAQIRKHLSAESAPLLKQAFRVINQKTEARFRTFCKENGISRKQIHFYYHGSLAENFWSILTKGLTVNPNARIAGKMFGHGSYFATRARKSLRYTDIGNIHASHAKTGFLAVFKVAYKHPWDIHAWKPSYTELRYKKVKENGYDAVFAHAGKDLLNDEIIVYQDCQSTICYLLEMEQRK